jgi:hypothetical protein
MAHLIKSEIRKNVKANRITVSAYQKPGTTWENITGANITYTPTSDCNFIIYEYTTIMRYYDAVSNIDFKLQFGSDINNLGDLTTNNEGYFTSIGPNSGTANFMGPVNFKFLINQSLWSGEKVITLQAKNNSNATEGVLHYSYDTTAKFFNPFVIIYSV